AVKSETEDEREQKQAKAITDMICRDDDTRLSPWYDCIMCCQGMNPFNLNQQGTIDGKVRSLLYGESDLDAETTKKMCDDLPGYAKKLKEVSLDWRGGVKACCGTEDGMKEFMQAKFNCFMACDKETPDMSLCKQ
ncbi:hypothetical protein BGX26_003702, partial [Mortierella sp. AD094]